jgi:hypothetical protein
LQLFEEQLSIKASLLDKSDIFNYNKFMKEKHCGFIDISDIFVIQVENVYKRLSVLDYIKKYQNEINQK